MAKKKKEQAEDPHDILAAEEFPPPAGADADTPQARAHRAAQDPSAWDEPPHDILAAEEYPPPAHADVLTGDAGSSPSRLPRIAAAVAAAAAGYALVRRFRG